MLLVQEKGFYKRLFMLSVPVAMQNLISFSVNMADTVMVGSLGEVALSAVSQANQVSVLLMMFIKGISSGSSVMISQYWGKRDMPRIKHLFSIGFQLSLLMSLLFFSASFFAPHAVMRAFVSDETVIQEGMSYLTIVCFSYVLYALTENFLAMLRSVEVVKIALCTSILSLVLNLSANYVLIFGKLGFPALGLKGAAIATVFARGMELLTVLVFLIFFDKRLSLKWKDLFSFDKPLWLDYLKYGIPLIAADLIWGVVGTVKSMIMGRLGPEAIAANSMTEVLVQLGTMFVFGLAAGSSVLIGKSVGAGQYDKTRSYAKTMQILFAAFGLFAGAVTFLLRVPVISLYDVGEQTREYAMQFMAFGSLTLMGTSYAASCFQGINRGAGDVKFVLKVNTICGWVVVIPLTFLSAFVFRFPPPITYFFSRCDQLVKILIAYLRLRGNHWIRNVTKA